MGVSEGVPVNEKEKEGVTFKRIRLAQTRAKFLQNSGSRGRNVKILTRRQIKNGLD